MNNQKIDPEKITKPIQLLAAWLIGLIILVGALIAGAVQVNQPNWLPIFFSISAVAIIPMFLYLIFQLQTKYRPQMQEDHYYSEYLNKNTMTLESRVNEELTKQLTNIINDRIKELATVQEQQFLDLDEKISVLLPEKSDEKSVPLSASKELFDNAISTDVLVNQKLDNLEEIEGLLNSLNVRRIGVFGDKPEFQKPDLFVLSFGWDVNFKLLQQLILKLTQYGLSHIRIVEESFKSDKIYIGSYAFGTIKGKYFETLKLTDDVIMEIQKMMTTKAVYAYVNRNMK